MRKTLVVAAWFGVLLLIVIGVGISADKGPGKVPPVPAHTRAVAGPALVAQMEKLRPLHTRMGKPQRGDWLLSHPESGQTFAEYVASDPVMPRGERRMLYIQPLGDFTKTQRAIMDLTADFMSRYFGIPCKVLDALRLSVVPAEARRTHSGQSQILTSYVLQEVLRPRLPDDAAAYIAFTASDLWPGEGWNYVFGEASLRERIGVWSLHRNGDPDTGAAEFRLCLLRTMKMASHETGHMFSMEHCILYECNMCGCNSMPESDRRPILLCPECVAKVWYATGCDPAARYRSLAGFCKEQGLVREQEAYEKALERLEREPAKAP